MHMTGSGGDQRGQILVAVTQSATVFLCVVCAVLVLQMRLESVRFLASLWNQAVDLQSIKKGNSCAVQWNEEIPQVKSCLGV